jgi:hypothetical protein
LREIAGLVPIADQAQNRVEDRSLVAEQQGFESVFITA